MLQGKVPRLHSHMARLSQLARFLAGRSPPLSEEPLSASILEIPDLSRDENVLWYSLRA